MRSRRRRRAALLAACSAIALAAGCGEDEQEVQGVGEVRVGSVAALADCRDWNAGSEDARLATIDDIREQINLQDAPVQVPELSDDEAYELFENACEPEYAQAFLLHKLYSRAAGFSGFLDE